MSNWLKICCSRCRFSSCVRWCCGWRGLKKYWRSLARRGRFSNSEWLVSSLCSARCSRSFMILCNDRCSQAQIWIFIGPCGSCKEYVRSTQFPWADKEKLEDYWLPCLTSTCSLGFFCSCFGFPFLPFCWLMTLFDSWCSIVSWILLWPLVLRCRSSKKRCILRFLWCSLSKVRRFSGQRIFLFWWASLVQAQACSFLDRFCSKQTSFLQIVSTLPLWRTLPQWRSQCISLLTLLLRLWCM